MNFMSNLATPTVVINDNTIEIVPNSLKYKLGSGDINIRTQQAGSTVTAVVNEDAETKLSMVGFSVIMTAKADSNVQAWLDARVNGGVTIDFFDGGIGHSFRAMVLVSEPERSTGSEGVIELDFQGPPGV
jgi:hypothetical protein